VRKVNNNSGDDDISTTDTTEINWQNISPVRPIPVTCQIYHLVWNCTFLLWSLRCSSGLQQRWLPYSDGLDLLWFCRVSFLVSVSLSPIFVNTRHSHGVSSSQTLCWNYVTHMSWPTGLLGSMSPVHSRPPTNGRTTTVSSKREKRNKNV
jgi:hypothetical protein